MVNGKIVQKALKQALALENNPGLRTNNPPNDLSSLISQLIYDIFGGEILKTQMKKDWHFYNRIDGERVDFTRSEIVNSYPVKCFGDIPSTPEEICNYFAQEDYATFFMRFIWAFEEVTGLQKCRTDHMA